MNSMITTDGRPHLALRRWLRSQPMTRAELAARLGYDVSHVHHVVGGSKPLTANFRGRFLDEFGAGATAAAFPETADVTAGPPATAGEVA